MEHSLQETLSVIADGLKEFEAAFARELGGHAGLIGAMASHVLASPGKRIRPAMYLLCAHVQGAKGPISVDAAVALELIHTATLLHDDVNDGADQRRGKPAANRLWGNLAAVLMGDHLFAKAFRVMVDSGDVRILRAISVASERVAVGELVQLQETRNFGITEEGYLRIIGDKTASLFAASCEAGALAAANGGSTDRFREFGELVGLGFQIADDLLDYLGDRVQTGKTPGNDLQAGKITLPLIFALRECGEGDRQRMVGVLANGSGEGFETVAEFVRKHGGFDYAQRRADEYRRRALGLIADLPDSVHKRALEAVVSHSVRRSA
jgi:octaprenyl-diphosphate synthase